MNAPRPAVLLLILALVALVAFFIVFVGVGASGRQTSPRKIIDSAKAFFARQPKVPPEELQLCPEHLVFKDSPCAVTVKPSGKLLRKLVLSTQDVVTVELRNAPDEERPIVMQIKPRPFDGRRAEAEFSVRGKGAWITLRCETIHQPALPGAQPRKGCEVSG
jgi:hypothetical protein